MALQLKLLRSATNYGFDFKNAYVLVADIVDHSSDGFWRVLLRGYADKDARDLVTSFDQMKADLKVKMADPKISEKDIAALTDSLGQKPIGIYRDAIDIPVDKVISKFYDYFSSMVTANKGVVTKDIYIQAKKSACYDYIKTLSSYSAAKDV
jgi:hypothetical protein